MLNKWGCLLFRLPQAHIKARSDTLRIMMITFGDKNKPKYLTYVYGKEWDKEDFNMFSFRKTPLGWDINIWRLSLSYDDYSKVNGELK